jgi:hypothetical protein
MSAYLQFYPSEHNLKLQIVQEDRDNVFHAYLDLENYAIRMKKSKLSAWYIVKKCTQEHPPSFSLQLPPFLSVKCPPRQFCCIIYGHTSQWHALHWAVFHFSGVERQQHVP